MRHLLLFRKASLFLQSSFLIFETTISPISPAVKIIDLCERLNMNLNYVLSERENPISIVKAFPPTCLFKKSI